MNKIFQTGIALLKLRRDSVVASSTDSEAFIDQCGQMISDLFPKETGPIDARSPRYRALSRLSAHILPRPSSFHATDERSVVMVRVVVGSREGRLLVGQYPSHHALSGLWDVFSQRAESMQAPALVAEALARDRYGVSVKVSQAPFFVQRYDIATPNEICVDVLELNYYLEAYANLEMSPRGGITGWRWVEETDVARSSGPLSLANRETTGPLLKAAFAHVRRLQGIRDSLSANERQVMASLVDTAVRG